MQLRLQTGKEKAFAVVAWLAIAAGIVGAYLVAGDGEGSTGRIAVPVLAAAAVVVVASTLMFGRGRLRSSVVLAVIAATFVALAFACSLVKVDLLYAPRRLALGTASGTVAEVAARDAAWVEIRPAVVDMQRIGRARWTAGMTQRGRTRQYAAVVAPIVASGAEAQATTLFVCAETDEHLEMGARGAGVVAGRMRPARERERVAAATIEGLVVDEMRCVLPGATGGGYWTVIWILLVLGAASAGAAAVVVARR